MNRAVSIDEYFLLKYATFNATIINIFGCVLKHNIL